MLPKGKGQDLGCTVRDGPVPGKVLCASYLVLHCSLLGRRALPGSRAVASDQLDWEFVGAPAMLCVRWCAADTP